MAMESDLITADAVEATEYPELSDMYQVYAVPLTVANSKVRIEGGMPESMFIDQILKGVGVQLG
jgi:hypothetical protein